MKVTRIIVVAAISICAFLSVFGQESTQSRQYKTPEAWVDQVKGSGAVLELTLKDAIRLALTNNLEIQIENFNEELNRQRVFGTKGFYDPILRFQFGWNSSEQPNTSILDAGVTVPTSIFKRWTFNSVLQQNVNGGGLLEFQFNNNRSTTNSVYSFINPQYGSNVSFRFTQPLWKGFRETPTERQLKIYNLDSDISDSQFKLRVSDVVEQVERQYWELVFAIENYEALRQSLGLAIVQFHNNQKRVDIGVMAPIEITSSRAEVATREQDLIQSEVQIINAQNQFKRFLAPDPKDSIWDLTMIPSDRPQVQDVTISLDNAIDTALARRPEVEQITLQSSKIEVDRKYYKKDGKPSIDLVVAFTPSGTSGQVIRSECRDTTGDGVCDTVIPGVPQTGSPFYGGIGTAWGQVFGFDWMNYNAFINVEIPIRNRANEAQLAELAISERQLLSRMKDTQQLIIVDVRNAYEQITTQKKGLEAARIARELTEEQLAGENKRFEAGLSTNFEVLRYQRDLADAQVRELRARLDYQLALTALQQAMFTIIDERAIVTARTQ